MLPCTAQGMDAVRTGNRLVFSRMGDLAFGAQAHGGTAEDGSAERVRAVAAFFDRAGIPYRVVADMRRHLKFMLNVGINRVLAVTGAVTDRSVSGRTRELVLSAMREVVPLAACEGVFGENDIARWMMVGDPLSPRKTLDEPGPRGRATHRAGAVRRHGSGDGASIRTTYRSRPLPTASARSSRWNAPPHGSRGETRDDRPLDFHENDLTTCRSRFPKTGGASR